MKTSEMTSTQKKAFFNIKHAANDLLGGLENTMLDYPEDSEEYQNAKKTLEDHDTLVHLLYSMATSDIYGEGYCIFGKQAEVYLKNIRFCGKEWLMERVEARLRKEGY